MDLCFAKPPRWRIRGDGLLDALCFFGDWIDLLFLAGLGGEGEKERGLRQSMRSAGEFLLLALAGRGGKGSSGGGARSGFGWLGGGGGSLCRSCSGRPWRRGEQRLEMAWCWRWWSCVLSGRLEEGRRWEGCAVAVLVKRDQIPSFTADGSCSFLQSVGVLLPGGRRYGASGDA